MTKHVYIFILFIFVQYLHAQVPPICGSKPAMTSYCADACIICDIDGFTGRNNSNIRGQAPPGFCTLSVHHMQWIGFIAGTADITLEVRVSNCALNNGLEIGLYESLNCTSYRQVSECDTDVRNNSTRIFKNTVPLTIGQYYYFVMDGSGNDVCDWTIKVIKGSTKVAPLSAVPDIIAPDKACQNATFDLKTSGISGATFYTWTLDGVFIKNEKESQYKIAQPGKYQLCIEASNVCDRSPKSCKTIEILPTPTSTFHQEICFGECFKFYGIDYCSSGVYEVRIPASNSCDSIILFDLKVADKITTSTSLHICEGDTLKIGDGILTSDGKHEVRIQNQEGCDIFLNVNLKIIICNIKASITAIPVRCTGENSGSILFKVDRGTAPFTYKGFKIENPSIIFNGKIDDSERIIKIDNLDEGNYSFTIEDTYGNSRVLNIFVPQPSKLQAQQITSDYTGFQVSCYGYNDGYYKIVPSGGMAPYTFAHDRSDIHADSISQLGSGHYSCIVTDANGCTIISELSLNQPDSLTAEIQITHPGCEGLNTGQIVINNAKGGVAPYAYAVNNLNFTNKNQFQRLTEGTYKVYIKDANRCTLSSISSLKAAEIPVLQNDKLEQKVILGDSLDLGVSLNLLQYMAIWTPSEMMSCPTCLNTKVLTVDNTNYQVEVKSKDGCIATSNIYVEVEKKRSFMISNVFTPNMDHLNDKIKVYTGNDVDMIHKLSIFDRWGNLIYMSENIGKGLTELEWDGTYQNKKLVEDNYTWIAEVRYIDNQIKIHTGSLLVLN